MMSRWLMGGLLALSLAGVGALQAQTPAQDDVGKLKARLEAQERELQELKRQMQAGTYPAAVEDPKSGVDPKAVEKIVGDVLKKKDDEKKKADAEKKAKDDAEKAAKEEEGFRVGSDLSMKTRYDRVQFFTGETPNKDFTWNFNVRMQEDTVFWNQSNLSRRASPIGIGDLQDGTFFRRIRLHSNGVAYEVWEYNFEFALEQVKEGIDQLDECYVGLMKIPVIGTIRVGHMRVPQGFEGDQMSSSRAMQYFETAAYTDAFYQKFAPGIMFTNSFLDQHMTYELMGYRQENQKHNNDGADFGDGQYAATGRITALPYYELEGKCWMHLGVSASWRKAEKPDPGVTGPGTFQLRARPEMRDAIGDYSGVNSSGLALATVGGVNNVVTGTLLPGNATRLVDTGSIVCGSSTCIGTEFVVVNGPASLQAEWAYCTLNDTTVGAVPALGFTSTTHGDRSFNGGYVSASYFLTGEHRTYDRRLGREGTDYFNGPYTNFWLTRTEDGDLTVGRGAVELCARYSYLNLNDGPVRGGVFSGETLGVNWYFNPSVKVQFDYMINQRYDRQGSLPVDLQGFGTRVQWIF